VRCLRHRSCSRVQDWEGVPDILQRVRFDNSVRRDKEIDWLVMGIKTRIFSVRNAAVVNVTKVLQVVVEGRILAPIKDGGHSFIGGHLQSVEQAVMVFISLQGPVWAFQESNGGHPETETRFLIRIQVPVEEICLPEKRKDLLLGVSPEMVS